MPCLALKRNPWWRSACCFILLGTPLLADPAQPLSRWIPFDLQVTEALESLLTPTGDRPPAGARGYVRVAENRLVFADGSAARFYGTHLAFDACFPEKQEALRLARGLRVFGYNAVRLMHLDYHPAPLGIFENKLESSSPDVPYRRRLSAEQMEKLDFLVHALRQEGIHIVLPLLVSREFLEVEGVREAPALRRGGNPVSLFDPHCRTLQEQYALELLTHKNAHTGLTYAEDPAVILVEISNESSLIQSWVYDELNPADLEYTIPLSYARDLDRMWNRWLREKYGTPEAVQEHWGLDRKLNETGFDFARPRHRDKKNLSTACLADAVRFYQEIQRDYFEGMRSILMEAGVRAPVTGISGIQIPEDLPTMGALEFIDKHFYWDHPAFPDRVWNNQDFRMRLEPLLTTRPLAFIKEWAPYLGTGKPLTLNEWNHVYPNPYAYETPLALSAVARQSGVDALLQFAFSHHREALRENTGILNFFDIIHNPQQLLLGWAASRLFLGAAQPVIRQAPGMFEAATPTLHTVMGQIAGQSHSLHHFTITTDTDGALVLSHLADPGAGAAATYLLLAISRVANTGAGNHGDIPYQWGGAPVLLETPMITLKAPEGRRLQMFPLDPSGRPGKPVTPDGTTLRSTASPWYLLREYMQ